MLPIGGTLYYTTQEAADRLGVVDSRVRQLVQSRKLIPHRIGPRTFFHPDKVEQLRQELEEVRNAPPKKRKSYYKPKPKRLQDHLDYKSPEQRQKERKARMVRTRVAQVA